MFSERIVITARRANGKARLKNQMSGSHGIGQNPNREDYDRVQATRFILFEAITLVLVHMKHLAFILALGKKKVQSTEEQGRKGVVGY